MTCRTLEEYYHVKANTFERQYKDHLSGFRSWDQLGHADQWLVFADNIGASICIDETALSNGELYTIVTNRSCRGRKGTLIAMIKGVSADRVTEAIMRIDEHRRSIVQEITLDMSNSMHLIAKRCFPNAMRTIDRFHIQKLANDALQEMRIAHRWDAIQADTDAREEAKCLGLPYTPVVLANGDTPRQLLARSRYLLFKSADKWTQSQKRRAEILFEQYPDLREAYSLAHSLRMIFSKNTVKDAATAILGSMVQQGRQLGLQELQRNCSNLIRTLRRSAQLLREQGNKRICRILQCKDKGFQGDSERGSGYKVLHV